MLDGKKMKKKYQDNLQKRYKLKEKGKPKVKEAILQDQQMSAKDDSIPTEQVF